MSKTAANVKNFLSRLAKKLKPLGESELQTYLKYKAIEVNYTRYVNSLLSIVLIIINDVPTR